MKPPLLTSDFFLDGVCVMFVLQEYVGQVHCG